MVLVVWWRILWGSRVVRLETWAKTRRGEKIPPPSRSLAVCLVLHFWWAAGMP